MTIIYRKGTIEDSYSVFMVFLVSLTDYSQRMNVSAITGGNDPEVIKNLWERRKSMFEFLAGDAYEFWVAEKDGEIVGYARSIKHEAHHELTEFFVHPAHQSSGLGGELLARAFPETDSNYRTIIATLDERALYRYMKLGLRGRFLLKYFNRKAEKVTIPSDLKIEPMDLDVHLESINQIDSELLYHTRESIHHWLVTDRGGFVYQRDGKVVGYGYIGHNSGPFAVMDENDFPAILAHAESLKAEKGEGFGGSAPMINRKAIEYFLERKYKIDSFSAIVMTNLEFGRFENYLSFTPEYFL